MHMHAHDANSDPYLEEKLATGILDDRSSQAGCAGALARGVDSNGRLRSATSHLAAAWVM